MSDSPQIQKTEENQAIPVELDFYISAGKLLETVTVDLPVSLPEGKWSFITIRVGGRFVHVTRESIGL